MSTQMMTMEKVVGAKQVKRALRDGKARRVFLAKDADPRVTEPIAQQCLELGVGLVYVSGMKELGAACGIHVGAAVVAAL